MFGGSPQWEASESGSEDEDGTRFVAKTSYVNSTKPLRRMFGGAPASYSEEGSRSDSEHYNAVGPGVLHTLPVFPDGPRSAPEQQLPPGGGASASYDASAPASTSARTPKPAAQPVRASIVRFPPSGAPAPQKPPDKPARAAKPKPVPKPAPPRQSRPPAAPVDRDRRTALQIIWGCCFGARIADSSSSKPSASLGPTIGATIAGIFGVVVLAATAALAAVALAVAVSARDKATAAAAASEYVSSTQSSSPNRWGLDCPDCHFQPVSRIAFGSKYQAVAAQNGVWAKAVIPEKPDAWIWTGSMAYMDMGPLDCDLAANQQSPLCSCSDTYLTSPPAECQSGSLANAQARIEQVLAGSGYSEFLDYMCPGYFNDTAAAPPGATAAVCPRPILGIWGSHDYSWSQGDRRLPGKADMKQVFLDGLGEPANSPRRSSLRGAYQRVSLPSGVNDDYADVILLDERYHRSPAPCAARRDFCSLTGNANSVEAWCQTTAGKADPRYLSACAPWSEQFGSKRYAVDATTGELVTPSAQDWQHIGEDAGMCDVLGEGQRAWLQRMLDESTALVKIVVAPSGLIGNPMAPNNAANSFTGACNGNEWDCFRPAQVNLIHKLANSTGCVIVLSGDAPHADFKVIRGGSSLPYAAQYAAQHLTSSIYQITTGGMHASSSQAVDTSCGAKCCGRQLDASGVRIGGVCAVYDQPSFGVMNIDWEAKLVNVRIMNADGSGIAISRSGQKPVAMDFYIDLQMCLTTTA